MKYSLQVGKIYNLPFYLTMTYWKGDLQLNHVSRWCYANWFHFRCRFPSLAASPPECCSTLLSQPFSFFSSLHPFLNLKCPLPPALSFSVDYHVFIINFIPTGNRNLHNELSLTDHWLCVHTTSFHNCINKVFKAVKKSFRSNHKHELL